MLLQRDSTIPLYSQLLTLLHQKITRGDWATGDQLPTEKQLSETYGVSLITVRQSLAELVKEGLITRQAGRGTFVSKPRITYGFVQLASFTDEQEALGKRVTAVVLNLSEDEPTRAEAELLELERHQTITRFSRIRLVDGEPIMFATTAVVQEVGRQLTPTILEGSFYSFLRGIGYPIARATEAVEASTATRSEAAHLKLKARSPVLRTRRVAYTRTGTPFEITDTVAGASRIRVYLNLYERPDQT